jgi:hypothetical protein
MKLRQKRRLLRKQSNHDEDLFARRIIGGAIDLGCCLLNFRKFQFQFLLTTYFF